eukprot:8464960-Lingulodinium_polyedra.AAC.1
MKSCPTPSAESYEITIQSNAWRAAAASMASCRSPGRRGPSSNARTPRPACVEPPEPRTWPSGS